MIVFTGVSGSGKSSLAFDTLFVEGQRRYLESLPHSLRRLLPTFPQPLIDHLSGLSPTIAIEQKLATKTPRSTVGTMTSILDFLRVLFARLAVPHCPVSREPLAPQSIEQIRAALVFKGEAKVVILAPLVRKEKGDLSHWLQQCVGQGYTRLRIDGGWVDASEPCSYHIEEEHDIDIVIDRLQIDDETRLNEALLQALEQGKGVAIVVWPELGEEKLFSQYAHSPISGLSYPPLEPADFSFNHPNGMCTECQGLGISSTFDLDKIFDPKLSIADDCCKVGSSYQTVRYGNIYRNLARIYRFSVDTPWEQLSSSAKEVFLYGTAKKWTPMCFTHPETGQRWEEYVQWKGVLHEAKVRLLAAKSTQYRNKMSPWLIEGVCPECRGSRLLPYPSAAQFRNKTLHELTLLPLDELALFFKDHVLSLGQREFLIGQGLIEEIEKRLVFLNQIGLGYLSLSRSAPTLSGGESQRVRLASQMGAGLVGVTYVLDEPSVGLHPEDHHKLIQALFDLKQRGNTLLIVEHDLDTMQAADTIVDIGPKAGREGGRLVFIGPFDQLLKEPSSLTGAFLSGRKRIVPIDHRPRDLRTTPSITIRDLAYHNLANITVRLPLHGLVAITGVSGSGKSSLITQTLIPALKTALKDPTSLKGPFSSLEGIETIDKVIAVDQSPIGRTSRSNPATYIKLFDEIREVFAEMPLAKAKGLTPSHFSFNIQEGSCPYCKGLGTIPIDMDFMEESSLECPQCLGKRFDSEVLSILYKGKSIYDLLETDVEEALSLFEALPSIRTKLKLLKEVGLHYIKLGQPSTTLSGGEAQRIKLARELSLPSSGHTLYLFDEPTTGLHFQDIERLLSLMQKLIDKGHSIFVVEHHLEMIQAADWVIDLGPGPGKLGGKIVGEGPPLHIQTLPSATGRALREEHRGAYSNKVSFPFSDSITILEAEENTLRKVSLQLPKQKLIVFAGPSGSGKSSLAIDTLLAEGQRRYFETLSPYVQSLLPIPSKPKVAEIEGLSPTIALEHKTGGLNPRSTVGTITEIYDLLRLLYTHLGRPFDPSTQKPIREVTVAFIVEELLTLPEGTPLYLMAPLKCNNASSMTLLQQALLQEGYVRARYRGAFVELEKPLSFQPEDTQIELVLDRLKVGPKAKTRLFEAVEKGTQKTQGRLIVMTPDEDLTFRLGLTTLGTDQTFAPLSPQTFSFNHIQGMCHECQGLGVTYVASIHSYPPLLKRSIEEVLESLFPSHDALSDHFVNMDTSIPIKQLSDRDKEIFFHGNLETSTSSIRWIGLVPLIHLLMKVGSKEMRKSLQPLMQEHLCAHCQGERLNPLARNVRLEHRQGTSHTLPQLSSLPLSQVLSLISSLQPPSFLEDVVTKIIQQLEFLISLELEYLSLERKAPTLSAGELQRIRLAQQLGTKLSSCLYILEEPTRGLHPHNIKSLMKALHNLKENNNTLLIIEHNLSVIGQSDHIVDFGPKAGQEGGRIIAEGSPSMIEAHPTSLTGAYLARTKTIPLPQKLRQSVHFITIEQASLHNLKSLSLSLPTQAWVSISGVSGSGKSTLIQELLLPAALQAIRAKSSKPITYRNTLFTGLSAFDQVLFLDQNPIGTTSRADVSSYSDVQTEIRSLLASLKVAKQRGLLPKHFSPNHLSGMCRTCWGLGYQVIQLQFLPSAHIVCPACKGAKLNPVSLEVTYKGRHFGQILQLTIDEALFIFETYPKILKRLKSLHEVGIGYLTLGQTIASLSGGEVQRLRLSNELSKARGSKVLYIFDEPSSGLHIDDLFKLIPLFHRLVDRGHTLIMIEHHPHLLMQSDFIVDLGPKAGSLGGEIVAIGTPKDIALNPRSLTGQVLYTQMNSKVGHSSWSR
jgi:excinuclease ABC subunit A